MDTQTQSMEIAKTIIQQVQYGDRWFLPAVGAKNFVALPESKEYQGGVRFSVNGQKHKGYVNIELRWVDDYTISFMGITGEVVKQFKGVFCDMLIDVLDYCEGK